MVEALKLNQLMACKKAKEAETSKQTQLRVQVKQHLKECNQKLRYIQTFAGDLQEIILVPQLIYEIFSTTLANELLQILDFVKDLQHYKESLNYTINWSKMLIDKLITKFEQFTCEIETIQAEEIDGDAVLYVIACLNSLSEFAQPYLEFILETSDLELIKDFASISQMIKTLVKKGLIRSIQHDLTSLSTESRESAEFIQNCHKYPQLLQESLLDVKSRCNSAQVFDYFKVHLEDCFFKSYGDLIR